MAAGRLGACRIRPCVCFLSPWIAPLPPTGWGKLLEPKKLKSPFQADDTGTYPGASRAWMGRVSPSSQQQAVATGYHHIWTWHLNGFAFQLRQVFIACSLKARERQSACTCTRAQKCRGGEWAKENLAWGCLFMRTLNNSFLSLLSSSQRDKNKRVFLAYCLELRIVKREENITVTEGDTRKSVTFNCSTYNQSHQIKALYIFLNNLWLGSGYERTRTPAIAMQREAC